MGTTVLVGRGVFTHFCGHVSKSDDPVKGALRGRYGLLFTLIILSILLLAGLMNGSALASSRTEKNQDIVFLVDTSSSMRNIFDDVRRAILDYVLEGRPGDNVVLISFGEKVELRIRQKISSDEDLKLIERELASLEPTEYFTNITGALDRGMQELRLLAEKDPNHLRTIVLMSDGKNNPQESTTDPITFDEILAMYPGLLQGPGFAFFYLSLGDDPDPQVLSFMEVVEGSAFDLSEDDAGLIKEKQPLGFAQIFVEPVSIDLGVVLGPKETVPVSLAFFPARGNLSGQIITAAVSSQFEENPSWRTIIEVVPAALNCSDKPWSRSFLIKVESVHEGTLVGALELKPLPGHVLFIDPPEIAITLTLRQPHVKVEREERLEFGPINPRRKFQETQKVLLVPNPAAAEEKLQATHDIVPPEGMTLTTNIEKQEGIQELAVTVATDETFRPHHSMTLEGAVYLSGAERAIAFSRNKVNIRITVAPPPATSHVITGILSWLKKFMVPGLVVVLIALIAGMAGYWWLKLRSESALEGKLFLLHLKGRSLDGSKPVTLNLHNIGRSLGRDTLTMGSSKDAGITLPHKSVAAHHCEVYARVERGQKRIYIEPVGKNSVIVNLQKIDEPVPLSDRDMLEIGAYTFRFENPHPYKQIVVKFLDGRILKGTPASWDIESDGFSLFPRDALPGSDEEIYVSFLDLKAVYFVRDFDGQIGKKIVSPSTQIRGIRMKLTFHDAEEMVGYTSENYSPASARFYFFPVDQSGNTISLVVERRHLKESEALGPAKQKSADATTTRAPGDSLDFP